jgi:superfamily II DNA or RNA helicase
VTTPAAAGSGASQSARRREEEPDAQAAVRLNSHRWRPRYATSREDLVAEFFAPALDRAMRYDRAVGYFRSSFYSLTGTATARFALRGGMARLLCAPELTEDDERAIQRGVDAREVLTSSLRLEIERILIYPTATKPLELLANLIALGTLEVRFALWNDQSGLFHDKVGIFRDNTDDAISFSGSVNETWRAWHPLGNHESFEVFKSWDSDNERVVAHQRYFDSLWDGTEPRVRIYTAPEAFTEGVLKYAAADPEEGLRATQRIEKRPPRRLFDHQNAVLRDWEHRGYRGIIDHATGSGKTLTALNAVRDWIATGKPALVVVPSHLLLEQWRDEAAKELDEVDPTVVLAGGGHSQWRRHSLLRLNTQADGPPRLTIATVQTASTREFLGRVDDGPHLLVVADEVHRLGSREFRAVMTIEAGGRLGLSATPGRAGDTDGTAAIEEYFGAPLDPRFTLRDGIEAGRLCRYEYFVHLVNLDEDEMVDWQDLSGQIAEAYAREKADASLESSHRLKFLLIQRSRIAKQARAKIGVAAKIVVDNYRDGQHWLLYCDDQKQMRALMTVLRKRGVDALEYHSAMEGDRDATLNRYRRVGGALVAIRCLDEGVDIPSITHAVILASSRNPREFIQRRGRVLRLAEGKFSAVIHDLLVVPPDRGDARQLDGLLRAEMARAREFAGDALNRSTETFLDGLCIKWKIDPDELRHIGIEED